MSSVEVIIQEPSIASSVINPEFTEVTESALLKIEEIMNLYKKKLIHEEPFANCTSDMVAHI